ncbi:cation:proton antiporter [Pontiella sulfatireligans]|uniref:Na(+)/H(+)-K(+) antiporter GerN n=1 Tax=Pontiella sulfatireligans TaxID=2750658 RepID=A0A6C2UQF5_9BACT|nr:cation:proton antiporter [Pontiella sulfatireligans]VGO22520.1 Na(+)/H(+)-K(+) antiporter GerN [Pontiella sulfatireligans]
MQEAAHVATNAVHHVGGDVVHAVAAAAHNVHEAVVHQAEASSHSITHMMMHLIIQLAVIIVVAKIGGYLFQRFLKMPSVLGELASGMLIGPYALGGMIDIPNLGILFAESHGFAATPQLYGIATLASIILLFLAGLETDLAAFIRYSVVGSFVGLGGLFAAFVLGDLCAVFWPGNGIDSFMDPAALFLGVISVATSVGITARILAEKQKMASPEGVTILAGAVFDDVFGIVTLAIVMGMAKVSLGGGEVNWGEIGIIAAKAIGFFVVVTALGLIFSRKITAMIKKFKSTEIIVSICFGLALLLAGLAEMAGLAMIIGAYIMGLALSRTDLAHEIEHHMEGVYNLLVPIFFCVMGMMVDFAAMKPVLIFGSVYSLLAIVSKVVGCGLPAYAMKFNLRGSLRIGLGMLPRGEVALIVAGIGLASGIIDQGIFGVSIMMTVVTTMLAPPLLVKSFEGGSGLRKEMDGGGEDVEVIELAFPSRDITEFLLNRFVRALQAEEFFVHHLHTEQPTYRVLKDDIAFTLVQDGGKLIINVPQANQHVARMILLEELLSLTDLLESTKQMKDLDEMGSDLMSGLFA